MVRTRGLPPTELERLERLERENWRSEVSTGAVQPEQMQALAGTTSVADALAQIMTRLGAVEERLAQIEEGTTNG